MTLLVRGIDVDDLHAQFLADELLELLRDLYAVAVRNLWIVFERKLRNREKSLEVFGDR